MNVKDLYFDVLCENEDIDIIYKIVLAIKKMALISVSFHWFRLNAIHGSLYPVKIQEEDFSFSMTPIWSTN